MADEPRKKTRFGCSPGCLISLVAVLIAASVAGYFAMRPVSAAKKIEQEVNDRFGAAPTYVPSPDGAVAPERLEVFMAVRSSMLLATGHIERSMATIEAIDQADDIDAGQLLLFMRTLVGIVPQFLDFMNLRHAALLEYGMGLGEYFYIYAMAYGDELCPSDETGRPPAECEWVTGRMTREYAQMLRNQLDNPDDPPVEATAAALRREIAALEAGERALPWHGELPAPVAASLAPYRERLEPLFCAETGEMELAQKNRNIGGIGD